MTSSSRPTARLLAAVLVAFAPFASLAGDYPSRPIRVVVAFPPGGGADLTARLVAQKMSVSMRQPIVVENKPGANGVLGADSVAKAAPDGYTLLIIDRGALGINPSLYAKLPYDPLKDFAYVGIATEAPYVMVANPALGARTVAELASLAKSKPRSIPYGSFGVGSMAQLNIEAFSKRMGIELLHVPYKGAGPAVLAVASGEVGIAIASAPSVLGLVRDGRLQAVAVGASARLALFPDVPTLSEAGVSGKVLIPTYFAFASPAGTPAEIVAKLNAAMKQAIAAPDVIEMLTSNGLVPTGSTPEAMAALVKDDVAHFATIAKSIGLKPQ